MFLISHHVSNDGNSVVGDVSRNLGVVMTSQL
jgi:hypothetical protein